MNYTLPNSNKVSVDKLCQVFDNTTNSYKYLWFMAILTKVRFSDRRIFTFDELILEMMKFAWYPLNYFKLSFGAADKVLDSIKAGLNAINLSGNINSADIEKGLLDNHEVPSIKNLIANLSRYVPYRLLTPWFSSQLRGIPDQFKNDLIVKFASEYFEDENNSPLYKINGNTRIEISEKWCNYLKEHHEILQSFCLWHFVKYLEKLNPNVPSITEKLFEPRTRDLKAAREYWGIVIESSPSRSLRCIYTDNPVTKATLSLDHYIPWSFVTHDLIWNISPTLAYINSSKNDSLPDHNRYIDKFVDIQHHAFTSVLKVSPRLKALEDFSILFNDSNKNILNSGPEAFKRRLKGTILSLNEIASNLGFSTGWFYRLQ